MTQNEIDWSVPYDVPQEPEKPVERSEEKSEEKAAEHLITKERAKELIIQRFSEQVDQLVREAAAVTVRDEESAAKATDIGAVAKRIMKAVNAQVEELISEPKAYIKGVKSYGEGFTARLNIVYNAVVKKLTDYNQWLELERRKREEVAKKATEEYQRVLDEEAEKAGVEAPQVTAPIMPEEKTKVKGETGSTAYTGGRWKATVTKEEDVPREYCSPDSKKINAAVRAGIREIPGVEIKKDEKVRIRT